jgi:CRISPR-associated protein Cmr6
MPEMAADVRVVLGKDAGECKNRSLRMDKFTSVPRDSSERKACLAEWTSLKADAMLQKLRWKAECLPKAVCFDARLQARMVVNHAVGVVKTAGLALDRFTGLPYIPGSALKGLARAGARDAGEDPQRIAQVLGNAAERDDSGTAGTVAFLAAFPLDDAKIELDVVTCHHPAYCRGDRQVATDDENPEPHVFPAVAQGSVFRFVVLPVVHRVGAQDVADAIGWLKHGLCSLGVGAKTAAGYGWFEPPSGPTAEGGLKAANGQADDYPNEASFENAVLKRLDKPQEYVNLKAEIPKLREARNAGRVQQIKRTLADPGMKSARKRLKEKDWFPREWLSE